MILPAFNIQGDQLDMAVCFWYLVNRDLFSVHYCTVASFFSRYLNNTDMFIWSVCRVHPGGLLQYKCTLST